jgi:hypothetical protein
MGVIVIADLDTLLIALYVELTDRIIPSLGFAGHRHWQIGAPVKRSLIAYDHS